MSNPLHVFNPSAFISQVVTKRTQSLFQVDMRSHEAKLRAAIEGKNVLVIGGAGSIGSAYIKQLLHFRPGALVVVDHNENELTELTRDLRSHYNDLMPSEYLTYPIDYGSDLFVKLFKQRHFDIVAHFAAHKHVRSEKDIFSVESMIINNVFNTFRLLKLCSQDPPSHFFAVSTDKATNPANIMGASKRLMEKSILAFRDIFKVSTARFANVAFSNGSLPDGFLKRMAKRQPLSAPSDIRRYFVSAEEAGQLCLLGTIAVGSGDIIFPKLTSGDMMSFSDIATHLLQDLGYEIDLCSSEDEARLKSRDLLQGSKKYPVLFYKSDTSGEKEEEEFTSSQDEVDLSRFDKIGVIHPTGNEDIGQIQEDIALLRKAFDNPELTKQDLVYVMAQIIPEFHHLEAGKNLDQRL